MPQSQIWLRVATPFFLFVVASTVGILLLLNAAYQHRSSAEFTALAHANAEFIHAAHIPPTDRFAGYLSQVLGSKFSSDALPHLIHDTKPLP
jgi:hypothetical protein